MFVVYKVGVVIYRCKRLLNCICGREHSVLVIMCMCVELQLCNVCELLGWSCAY